ncbi:MAG: glycosyltransferase [Anaerolineales bacterium]|nr:glycosyltransferase [Anaerolineales bacterium]
MIHFSVVIPNLHTPTVGETVASLEHQTYDHAHYEVIVVGMDKYNLVRESDLVHFDRSDVPLSPARARNRGVAQARGDVIVFTDADCLARPDWLAVLAERFSDPAVTVVGGGVDIRSRNFWTLADNISMFYEYLDIHPAGERLQLPSLNLAIRRQAFKEVCGFDERYPRPSSEDADLTIRLRKRGHRLYFEPRAVVAHQPPRNRLRDLLRHGYYQGMYSTKVDPRYANEEGLPGLLHTRLGVALFSPLLAAGVVLRVFAKYKSLRPYWYTAPMIFLSKMAWCFGAAARPDERIWSQSV